MSSPFAVDPPAEAHRFEDALTPSARAVLVARYLRRDARGRVSETSDQMVARVARAVSEAELLYGDAETARQWEERFFNLLGSLRFLPNSPTLMNAGTGNGQLSACFVIPIEDSIESIFEAVRSMALIQRTGGGTGFDFSRLRPRGAVVSTTGGASSGPVSFMEIFNCATENIKQGGRRRGANIGILRVDHPDVLDFVDAKRDAGAFTNFNLSVSITDEFIAAVRRNDRYELVHPRDGRAVRRVSARGVFDRIVDAAWSTGDPGLLFLDAINRANPTPALGDIEATNPCGEVPMLPHEACTLGSVNLPRMLTRGDGRWHIDWRLLDKTVEEAIRFLDDVVSVCRYPSAEVQSAVQRTRKIGLGVMGFAELLIRLGVGYGSERALDIAERVMGRIVTRSKAASAALARSRGVFPAWSESVFQHDGRRLRHATCTSIAPTGTISIIAGTTSSIEPLFALAYRRVGVLDGATLTEISPLFLEVAEERRLLTSDVRASLEHWGALGRDESVPADVRALFATALEIEPAQHLRIQAAFQSHVDNAVSKTINLPENAPRSAVSEAYLLAHELGLKGVTVYRYGTRGEQVLQLGAGEESFAREHFARCDPGDCRL